ncbi:uncharacterized protein BT62DRAFT_994407 [Guyanagaster necrorhizus]|uniref:Uncharacterized protein n=1 Tax=Guyanagaster necrorhizus TaxID=856835 RepID=A0A9P7VSE9_9AGAR|nr:uncharacterized protein BT62DRAFT_994407 [Guyanagaster necrorhizus MCA 3950]KAG7446049.1 hypothetical protein BT62DRAFT_994407 [Guyanagaster necrorhizus MCA 3950]
MPHFLVESTEVHNPHFFSLPTLGSPFLRNFMLAVQPQVVTYLELWHPKVLTRSFFQQRENADSSLSKYSSDKSSDSTKIILSDDHPKRLAALDPWKDWEEMVKTFMSYNVNEFIANIMYSVILLLVDMNLIGLSATNKIFNKKQQRFEDTRGLLPLRFRVWTEQSHPRREHASGQRPPHASR